MKKIIFILSFLSIPFWVLADSHCPDYCSDGTFYSKGTYNSRSSECEYSSRKKCDYGCESRSECKEKPESKSCNSYCSRDIYYYNGEYNENEDDCEYLKKSCAYGCDEKTGCKTETRLETSLTRKTSQGDSGNEAPVRTQDAAVSHDEQQPESENEEENALPEVLVNPNIGSGGQSGTETLSYNKGGSREKSSVSGNGIEVLTEGENIKISGAGKTFIFKNNFNEIKNRYLASQRTIEEVEAKVEKENSGEEKPFYLFTMKTPAKLLWIFNFKLDEEAKIDAQSGKEIYVKKSLWHIFTSEPKPTEFIPNYCQKNKDCQKYEDDNLCNGSLYCDLSSSQCKIIPSTVIDCPAKKSADGCQENTCNSQNGKCEMKAIADNMVCDDENFCTKNDFCQSGKCISGANSCQCQNHSDCQKFEDGNLCNGTLFCNLSTGQCENNPATEIYCPTVYDTACAKNTCNAETGLCEMKPQNIGKNCEGSHPCVDSYCAENGKCEGSWNFGKIFSDGKKCQCAKNEDCQKYEDGNLCNGTLFCNLSTGQCENNPATEIYCPTVYDTACAKNTCNAETGLCEMKNISDNNSCDDGNSCTKNDFCKSGKCASGTNSCQCQNNNECLKFENGNLCDGTLFCNLQNGNCELNPSTKVYCPTTNDSKIEKNICQPKTGECAMTKIN